MVWDLLNMKSEINSWYRESHIVKPVKYIMRLRMNYNFNKILKKFTNLGRYTFNDINDLYSFIYHKYTEGERVSLFPNLSQIKVMKGVNGTVYDITMRYRTLPLYEDKFGRDNKIVDMKEVYITTNCSERKFRVDYLVLSNGEYTRGGLERKDTISLEDDTSLMRDILYDMSNIITNNIETVFEDMG